MKDKSYRHVIYQWFKIQNQYWMRGNFDPCYQLAVTTCYPQLHREEQRWQRIKEMQNYRKITPLKRETRFLKVNERIKENRLHMVILVSHRSTYLINNQIHQEEIEEWVQFQLERTPYGWKISSLSGDWPHMQSSTNQVITIDIEEDKVLTVQSSVYDRQKAVNYAETWWNSYNPNFRFFSINDCTNFISQCLYAGGIPMVETKNVRSGWWYKKRDGNNDMWSHSWAIAHSFYWHINSKRGNGMWTVQVNDAKQLELGDVICYDWEGNGKWNHNVIVTQFDANGHPLVNAHTFDSSHRYWEYLDSPAWTPNTKYAFFHIL